jgi:hypothetical protein
MAMSYLRQRYGRMVKPGAAAALAAALVGAWVATRRDAE